MENFYVLYGLNKGLIKIELEKLLKKFKNCMKSVPVWLTRGGYSV